ncbi:hypothetical protein DPEC_G00169200 [Dallia pectoralis]|uniref:Uncharacterized protein n=1 Tax=Dallia pectoralis TaxID=75939 RepID=A0ACC2GCG4_DALPE|nr:hypothetical protein DPEC_G00169200 [Dallia pectoralis]
MNEDSTDPSSLSCFTDPKPPESLVSDSSSGLDNSSEEPRFNIVVKEEPEDLDWDVNNTGECSDFSCNVETSSKPELLLNHKAQKPRSWPKDGTQISHLSNVNNHLKTQSTKESSVCSLCGKKFPRPSKLKRHLRTHTGEKPYQCSVCWKTFCEKRSLDGHKKEHTGVMPFSCSLVSVASDLSQVLNIKVKEEEEDPAFAEKPDQCSDTEEIPSTSEESKQHPENHKAKDYHHCSVILFDILHQIKRLQNTVNVML